MKTTNNIKFHIFDSKKMDYNVLPKVAGNYIFLLREGAVLPQVGIAPVITKVEIEGNFYQTIYTGIAKSNLRLRDYRQHFIGNDASHSTLRKSLGSLFGYDFIPRKEGDTKHKKFNAKDEVELSEWMKENLMLAYAVNVNPGPMEDNLISELNPPLNLYKNRNVINAEYRKLLSKLRRRPVIGISANTSIKRSTPLKTVRIKALQQTGILKTKTIRRNVKFDRTNNFRCKYGTKEAFKILRVECTHLGETKLFEIESKYLSDKTDSIRFKVFKTEKSFVVKWNKEVEDYIKEIKL